MNSVVERYRGRQKFVLIKILVLQHIIMMMMMMIRKTFDWIAEFFH